MLSGSHARLGDQLRNARLEHAVGLRELARRLSITPSYLSDIEADRRIPSELLLHQLADQLGLDPDKLMGLGGRMHEQTTRYVQEVPAAARLFRRIAEKGFDEERIKILEERVEEL